MTITDSRLFRRNGKTTKNPVSADLLLFGQVDSLRHSRNAALEDIETGLFHDDPQVLIRGVRKLQSVACLMGEHARNWERATS